MNQFDYKKVSRTLRQVMKAKRFTYEALAKKMGMSGSGLKKLLAANDCSLTKLNSLCSLLEIDLGEVLKTSKELKSTEIKFTDAQEKFFLANPGHFYFFWELIGNDMSLAKMVSTYQLDEKSMRKYLTALDKIGLIELHPGDKVKHRFGGKTHWNMVDSPVGQMAMITFQDGFLKKLRLPAERNARRRILRWINFSLKKESYEEFLNASNALLNEFIQRAQREKPLAKKEDLIPTGALMGVMEFQFRDVLEIPQIG